MSYFPRCIFYFYYKVCDCVHLHLFAGFIDFMSYWPTFGCAILVAKLIEYCQPAWGIFICIWDIHSFMRSFIMWMKAGCWADVWNSYRNSHVFYFPTLANRVFYFRSILRGRTKRGWFTYGRAKNQHISFFCFDLNHKTSMASYSIYTPRRIFTFS